MFAVWTLQSQGSARARPAAWAVSAGLGVGVGEGRGADAHLLAAILPACPAALPGTVRAVLGPACSGERLLVPGVGWWRPAALFLESAASREGRGQSGARSPADPGDSAEGWGGGRCRVCRFPDDGEEPEVCPCLCTPRGPAPS